MNIGEKIKDCRKNNNLTQEQLADKLCVSRQAITKWESNKGIPDIENIKRISELFNISVDYLLSDNTTKINNCIKESIDITNYKKTGKCRSKYDAVVKEKYSNAKVIYPLIRTKKLTLIENIIDLITLPGIFEVADSLNDITSYYLVQLEQRQLLVNVTKEFINSIELTETFTEKSFVIGSNHYKKASYVL